MSRNSRFRLKSVLLCLALIGLAAQAGSSDNSGEPIRVEAQPLSFSRLLAGREVFGSLRFRGGLVLSSSDERFGGFSGVAVSADGRRLMAVSDEGWWLAADVAYEDARPAALTNAHMAPLLDGRGKRARSKPRRDAEALAVDPAGEIGASIYVGFESRPRIEKFDMREMGFAARPSRISIPSAIAEGPDNAELEALGKIGAGPFKGSLLAISERNLDGAGNIRGWILNGSKSISFTLLRHEDYAVTDLAVLTDGRIVTLERSFSPGTLPGMAVRTFPLTALKERALVSPEVLFSGRQPFYLIDNMEGIAAHRVGGEERITVISDDNYNRGVQRTVIFQFALPR